MEALAHWDEGDASLPGNAWGNTQAWWESPGNGCFRQPLRSFRAWECRQKTKASFRTPGRNDGTWGQRRGETHKEPLPANAAQFRPIHIQPAPSLRPIHLTFLPSLRPMHPVSNQSVYSPAADPSAFHPLLHRRPPRPPLRPSLRPTPVLPCRIRILSAYYPRIRILSAYYSSIARILNTYYVGADRYYMHIIRVLFRILSAYYLVRRGLSRLVSRHGLACWRVCISYGQRGGIWHSQRAGKLIGSPHWA